MGCTGASDSSKGSRVGAVCALYLALDEVARSIADHHRLKNEEVGLVLMTIYCLHGGAVLRHVVVVLVEAHVDEVAADHGALLSRSPRVALRFRCALDPHALCLCL